MLTMNLPVDPTPYATPALRELHHWRSPTRQGICIAAQMSLWLSVVVMNSALMQNVDFATLGHGRGHVICGVE
jgi:hypothetical protein